ncbi:PucR family transcriptional regulator [Pseudonocardia endophytica]|uniref:PucR-like helix-turn-helix protein n=1 Tax=Pseudonocardia endophytica TaxID=401976 RepID=A0A4R1HI46_PSEEN|nr:PucR family transcriptional regulator [Pseudonocardia endophytica]TCK20513.1 PucR-like helix-turn-helix protein [Pseudonocardia endophytica]
MHGGEARTWAVALGSRLPDVLDEVAGALRADWPDYARFVVEHRAEVAGAAGPVVERLLQLRVEDAGEDFPGAMERDLFEQIGRIQWREGREISSLLTAFQVGARAFWHHVSTLAVEHGVGARELAELAEGVFLFVDRLSSATTRGYVREQSESGAARERAREELVDLLLSDRATIAAVHSAGSRAGWPVPDEVGIVLVQDADSLDRGLLGWFDPTSLPVHRDDLTGLIVPNPSRGGRRQRLATALRGLRAVVGASVPPQLLPASLRIAEIAARLQHNGVLADDPVFADEHLDAIIVHRDARLLQVLRAQVLRPLEGAVPSSRERLVETLTSWVRHMGDRQAMAAELHVHPQTVRYRMNRLHELFGDSLDTPDIRARLALALAWGAPLDPRATTG